MTVYSVKQAMDFIDSAKEKGYTIVEINEGSLGIGDVAVVAPRDDWYNFMVKEVYLNEWSSGQTIRCCSKFNKKVQAKVNEVMAI